MMRHLPEDEDARLEVLFSGAAEGVSDAGFSEQVIRRVARTTARRRIVLGVAAIAGFAIAAEPLWGFARALGDALIENTDRFALLAGWTTNPLVLAAGALILIAPRALRWLEE